MPIESLIIVLVPIIFAIIIIITFLASYKKVEEGKAIVITGARGRKVSFSGTIVIPVLEKYEFIDVTTKQIIVDLKDKNGLLTKDNYIVDLNVVFSIRVNLMYNDILMVAQTIGTQKASNLTELENMFIPKFSETLRTVAAHFTFEDLKSKLAEYKSEVLQTIGRDLNGFCLDDIVVNYTTTSVRKLEIK